MVPRCYYILVINSLFICFLWGRAAAADPRAPVSVSLSIGINPEFFSASWRRCDSRREHGGGGGAGQPAWGMGLGPVWPRPICRGMHCPHLPCQEQAASPGCRVWGQDDQAEPWRWRAPPPPQLEAGSQRGGIMGTVIHLSLSRVLKIVFVIVENEIC